MIIGKRAAYILLLVALHFCLCALKAQEVNYGNGLPATDALGRKLISQNDSSNRKTKFVGLFYWTWHAHLSQGKRSNDISQILTEHPEAATDYNHPSWPKDAGYYYWGKPLFDYYISTDRWVLRKHAEMLADAGVDVIVFDCTNGSFTWTESYMTLCDVFAQARKDGVDTPQIAFMLGFGPLPAAREALFDIYEKLYKPGLYKDLWFHWKGKPLIMAYPELVKTDSLVGHSSEIYNFFTFRPGQPLYNKGPERSDHWAWLEIAPQHGFVTNKEGKFEQVAVGVAQNWSKERELTAMNAPDTFGRSYTNERGQINNTNAVNYGYNFQEQWERAIEIDPEFIFVTGWNEWIAGRERVWNKQENAFPDQFSQEKSRDIEPMEGGHGDNYYYQLVNNIRRFKGVSNKIQNASTHKIQIDGSFKDWEKVENEFSAHKGSTIFRSSPGWMGDYYINATGRNDFIRTKITHDKKNIFFYIETAEQITKYTDSAWMRLLIDVDRNKETGWEGYDFIVNRQRPDKEGYATIEKNIGGWHWEQVGIVKYAVNNNEMELKIPKSILKIISNIDLEFKWSDNMQKEGDIMDFYKNGDVAPIGRFNYYYTE